jgi:hypothetical protein
VRRTPDPHKHIHDLVLGNPVLLSDLQNTPISEIIDFLAEAGKRMHVEDNPYLQESLELALRAGGLAEEQLRSVYAGFPRMFDPDTMFAQIDSTVGADYLDGWVASPTGPHCRVRAVGTRQLHITAGNNRWWWLTIIRGALTSRTSSSSRRRTTLTAVAARTLLDLDASHPICKHVAVAYWKGGDEYMDQIVRTSRIDKICLGGMSSVKHPEVPDPGIDLTALNRSTRFRDRQGSSGKRGNDGRGSDGYRRGRRPLQPDRLREHAARLRKRHRRRSWTNWPN